MTWIELSSAVPKQQPGRYTPFAWPTGRLRALDPNDSPHQPATKRNVFDVVSQRRSRREFSTLAQTDLAQLLWHSSRTQATSPSEFGFELEQRPTPSGGAIHPLHILVKAPGDDEWSRYDSRAHALVDVDGTSSKLRALRLQADVVLWAPEATKLLLVAEPGKTAAKYHHPESVIWRDAGALLTIMSVVAEGLGLNYCPLGIIGEPWASQLGPPGVLTGVGMALVGRRPL